MKFNLPLEVTTIAKKLKAAGFEAYLVGGCVRDLLLETKAKDWDIATNAKPQAIQKVFPESVYENNFGTVAVKTKSPDLETKIIEVTTFRKEGKYTDKRHPDSVVFAKTIEEDLSRRDFTINAMAIKLEAGGRKPEADIIDPFGGFSDLKKKLIRAVGDPEERLQEDALRLMRATRLGAELDFEIETKTASAIKKNAGSLQVIAKERIRDELVKIIMSDKIRQGAKFASAAARGIQSLEDLGLMRCIMPELREGINCGQNKHHVYSVWEHNLRALDYSAVKGYSLAVRLASLLHDAGKPRTKRGYGQECTFYNHEVVGAKITAKIMERLRFPKDQADTVTHLVRHHLFYYNAGEVSAAGVRRFLARVGLEHIDSLMQVREADRIGSGVPKAVPYKLRHLKFMIEKVRRDPISPKMLAVNGDDVMEILQIPAGVKVGAMLNILLDEVLENPEKNTKDKLKERLSDLSKLSDSELEKLSREARVKKQEFESGIESELKKKHYVR